MRIAKVNRKTKETSIEAEVNLDGKGVYKIDTGIGFLNHMLEQLSKHSLMDINLNAKGDLHIDLHHTTEDSGIVLGEAIAKALGDKKGIIEYATKKLYKDCGMITKVSLLDLSMRNLLSVQIMNLKWILTQR